MKLVIGIDPGKSGGIAWITEKGIAVESMPDTILDLWELINDIVSDIPMIYRQTECIAYLEQVHSSPQMGVKSSFTFGNGFGHLEMALTAANVPFQRIRPQDWQKTLGCLSGGNKNVTKQRAQELFPSLKITHKRADACLIAEFGRRKQ